MQTKKLSISGMGCGKCVHKIMTTLTSLKGVINASVNLVPGEAEVIFDPQQIDIHTIIQRIENTGYGAIELS